MHIKTNDFKKLITVLSALLLLGIGAGPASATNPGIDSAKYISDTQLKIKFNATLDAANTVDETKITITNNSGNAIAVTDNSAVVVGNSLTITTASVGGSSDFKIDDIAQGLDLAADAVKDSSTSDRNIEYLNYGVLDGQKPTFTAARTALNTIVLTFSETVTGSAIVNSFTVAGASSVTNSAPTASSTIILSTVGLNATNGTPIVNYVAATGDIADNAAIPNEIADGGAVSASDQVKPTFTAARTALNTIVLTFSEPVTGTAIENSFTVAGASSVTNTAPTANTTVTLTTVGLTATNGTPNVSYNVTTGDIADNSAAQNEIANGGAIAAADQVPPTFTSATLNYNTAVLNITFSETIYANLTNASKFHLNNISGTNNVNLTDATTTVTNGTILSFTLTEAQGIAALNISGVNGGDGGAVVLDMEAAGVTDLVNNTNNAELDNTVTETYTAAKTTAVITLNSAAYVSGTATVSVNDPDMNTIINSNQTLTVNLTTTTTLANLTLTLTETDVNTGIFNGTFTFGSASNGTTLGVSDGDTIYAKYADNDSALRSANATFDAVAVKLVINSTTYGSLTDRNGAAVTPMSMVAGVATVFNINATDANGILDTGFNGTMTISVNGSGTSTLTSYTFEAGDNGTKSVSVTDNVSETIVIYFNSTSFTNASTTQTVVPNRPFKLLFNNSMPLSTLTNSLQVNISVADAYNNLIDASKLTGVSFPANATQLGGTDGLGLGIKFNLSLSLPTPPPVSAYLDTISIVMTNANVNTYVAYVNDTVDETVTLKATAVFFSPAYITTNLSFLGAVSSILVSTNKTGNTANANSGENSFGTINISAQLRDASGNSLSVPGSVITFNSDKPTVLNVAGQTATTNASGIAVITVSTTNIAGTANITAQDTTGHEGTVTVTTTAIVDNGTSTLAVNPTARAGDNVTVYAVLYDYAGTVMSAGTSVSFNITTGDPKSTLNGVAKGTIVTAYTNSTGVATVIFRATSVTGGFLHNINATVVDEMGDIKQVGTSEKTITVSPNDAAVLVVLPASKGLANIKGANATFNVTVYDAYNNVNTTGAIKVNVSTTGTDLGNLTAGSTVVNNYAVITTSSGIGSMLYKINSSIAGNATLTFAVYMNETGQLPGLITNFADSVFVTTSGATHVTISPGSTVAAVNTNITLIVNLTDDEGNLIGIDGTNMSLIPSGGTLGTSSLTSAAGQASTNLTSSTPGDVTVTVYVEGLGPAATTVTFSGNATKFVMTPENSSVIVNETTNITIQAYDSRNNKASIYNGAAISTMTGIIPSVSGLRFGATSFTFNETGYARVNVTSATTGTYIIQAVALGLMNTTNVTFMTALLPQLTVSSNPVTVTAGMPAMVTFNVTSSGILIENATVTLSGVTTGSSITNASGLTVISVNATSAGTITVTANLSGYNDGTINITANAAEILTPALVSSITPTSRNAQLGTPLTLFMSVINYGTATATGVSITQASSLPATVSYQQWDGTTLIGSANTPLDMVAGATANFVLAINATSAFDSSSLSFNVSSTNGANAPISAVNTLTIFANATPSADIIMISTTLDVSTPVNSSAFFALATMNVGGANATGVSLVVGVPSSITGLAYQVNQTNSTTGAIIGPATGLTIEVGATPTFAVFLTPTEPITNDPADNRIMLQLMDGSGKVIGAQSVAISTT